MKIEINFKGMASEIITSITLGTGVDKKIITWLYGECEQGCTRGNTVYINGEKATDNDFNICHEEITAIRTLHQDTDQEFDFVELNSVSIILANGKQYDFFESLISRFQTTRLETEDLNLRISKFQYGQIANTIRFNDKVQNFENVMHFIEDYNDSEISSEDAKLLQGPLKKIFAELFYDKITDLITGEDEYNVVLDILNRYKKQYQS